MRMSGEQCVMTALTLWTLRWCARCWVSRGPLRCSRLVQVLYLSMVKSFWLMVQGFTGYGFQKYSHNALYLLQELDASGWTS